MFKVAGNSRIVNYITRVDVIDGKEYEGIFLQKVPSRVDSDKEATFVPNTDHEACFTQDDIVHKLPQPRSAGGSLRRSGHLVFKCDLDKWHLKKNHFNRFLIDISVFE